MDAKDKIVTRLPLAELWNERGPLPAERGRWLGREDLRRLLQAGPVRFAVADPGLPLRWIPEEDCHVFWKLDVRPHLVEEPERPFEIFAFPEGYAYLASEWVASAWTADGAAPAPVVLLERHH